MQCKICGKTVNSDYLKIHEWSHTGEKPIQCELCDYRCQTKDKLRVHMAVHQTEKNEVKLLLMGSCQEESIGAIIAPISFEKGQAPINFD